MSVAPIKREHLRIDVTLPLTYHILTDEQAQVPLPKHADGAYISEHFAESLRKVNAELDLLIRAIGEKNRLLGDVFRLLNQKIDLTRPRTIDMDVSGMMTLMPVNLSANGLSLEVRTPLEPGQRVDFLLLLDETQTPLLVRAKFIRIINPEKFIAAFTFEQLTADQERHLVNYVREQELIQLGRI